MTLRSILQKIIAGVVAELAVTYLGDS